MKPPPFETTAKAICHDRPQLAFDILRAAGYTKRAVLREMRGWAADASERRGPHNG